jgi:hypothetical protein
MTFQARLQASDSGGLTLDALPEGEFVERTCSHACILPEGIAGRSSLVVAFGQFTSGCGSSYFP